MAKTSVYSLVFFGCALCRDDSRWRHYVVLPP